MNARTACVIAATRFGLGPKPGDLGRIGDDPEGWLRSQLAGSPPRLEDAQLQGSDTILAHALELRRERRESRQAAATGDAAAAEVAKVVQYYRPIAVNDAYARARMAITTDRPFLERITQFWTNHFAVSIDKALILGLAGSYEREAIRPHVLGSFKDLLLAAERHPAMLLYLDNFQSAGPDSRAARRRRAGRRDRKSGDAARRIGLNENLAREILELHTLGAQGGYTQEDVTSFARVMTGWSLNRNAGMFQFRPGLHEPGAKRILGRHYREGGETEGVEVLSDLAAHPSTARFIATKLVRHFVADDPPAAAVARVAQVFAKTSGDLPSVYAALIATPAAWSEPFTKFKSPADYIYSAFRGLQLPADREKQVLGAFEVLGQRNYSPGSPAGWPDRSADWDGSSALLKRIEWADAVSQRLGRARDAAALAGELFGSSLTGATRESIARAASAAQALTLLLTSPEFMRR